MTDSTDFRKDFLDAAQEMDTEVFNTLVWADGESIREEIRTHHKRERERPEPKESAEDKARRLVRGFPSVGR